MSEKLKDAVDTLRNELKTDEELYYTYQSNIAMAFVDEMKYAGYDDTIDGNDLHLMANNAAKRFLDLLISQD